MALTGGTQWQYSLPGFGVLLLPEAIIFYFGLILILLKFKSSLPADKLLLAWLFLAALPAAITRDQFAVIRSNLMIPPLILISAWGLLRLRKALMIIVVISMFVFLDLFLENYFIEYPVNYSQSWQYGYKQAVQFVKERYSRYDQIIFTKHYGEPHEFIALYWPWNPVDYQAQAEWDYHANWYWVNALDKFKFVNDWEMPQTVASLPSGKNYLIVSSPDSPTAGNQLTTINFLDSKPAFIISERIYGNFY